ncbi:MAG: hypothetical protein NVSMB17_08710 [Candidatus Dormibacteria bacterium]
MQRMPPGEHGQPSEYPADRPGDAAKTAASGGGPQPPGQGTAESSHGGAFHGLAQALKALLGSRTGPLVLLGAAIVVGGGVSLYWMGSRPHPDAPKSSAGAKHSAGDSPRSSSLGTGTFRVDPPAAPNASQVPVSSVTPCPPPAGAKQPAAVIGVGQFQVDFAPVAADGSWTKTVTIGGTATAGPGIPPRAPGRYAVSVGCTADAGQAQSASAQLPAYFSYKDGSYTVTP